MPQPKCSDFWCKFGVFCSKTQNLELNLEFRSQNILKPINCQMCGIYFKNNFFLHVLSRIFSWLCLVFFCVWKVDISRHQETHEKALNLVSALDTTSGHLRTRVLDTHWGYLKSPLSGLALSKF